MTSIVDSAQPRAARSARTEATWFGAVGLRVTELLHVFGSTVLAHDPYADESAAAAAGVRLVPLAELLERIDVVSLHARLSDETRGMFDRAAFAAMRPDSLFVNTARGELVDPAALDEALASGAAEVAHVLAGARPEQCANPEVL